MEDKQLLAEIIVINLKETFLLKHLSGNLLDSIRVESDEGSNSVRVIIDAPVYDMLEYLQNKVVVHTNKGSYASKVNEEGGQVLNKSTGNHKGYVDNAIMKSMQQWKDLRQSRINLKQWGNDKYGSGSEI